MGITEKKPIDPTAPDLRPLFLATLNALRDYATRVAAHADPDEPGSEALSQALLKPLAEWESRPIGGQAGDESDEGEEGATTPPDEGAPGEPPKTG